MKLLFAETKRFFKTTGIKGICLLIAGCFLYAAATSIFFSPSGLISTGATGLSLILGKLTNIQYFFFLYGINITLLIIAFFLLGIYFSIKSLVATFLVPTFNVLFTIFINLTHIDLVEIINQSNIVFVVLASAILAGVGSGLTFIAGGSLGGFTIIESLLLKYFKIPYSVSLYFLSLAMIVVGCVTFIPIQTASGIVLIENKWIEGVASLVGAIIQSICVETVTIFGKKNIIVSFENNNPLAIQTTIKDSFYTDFNITIINENKLIAMCSFVEKGKVAKILKISKSNNITFLYNIYGYERRNKKSSL